MPYCTYPTYRYSSPSPRQATSGRHTVHSQVTLQLDYQRPRPPRRLIRILVLMRIQARQVQRERSSPRDGLGNVRVRDGVLWSLSECERDARAGIPPVFLSRTRTKSIRLHLTRTFPSPPLTPDQGAGTLWRLITDQCLSLALGINDRAALPRDLVTLRRRIPAQVHTARRRGAEA